MTEAEVSARRPLIVGAVGSFVLVIGFGVWAGFATLEGAVVAHGHVVVSGERQTVQHVDGGVIAELHVKEAQKVEEGELLLRLDDKSLRTELTVIEGQLLSTIALRARLAAETEGKAVMSFAELEGLSPEALRELQALNTAQQRLLSTRLQAESEARNQYELQRSQIDEYVKGLHIQKTAAEEQMLLSVQELEDQEALLASGLAQASRVQALRKEVAGLKGQIGGFVAQMAQANQRAAELSVEIARLVTGRKVEASTELRNIVPREQELLARWLELNERLSRLAVRAPSSGIVIGLKTTTPGAVIRPADIILSIVPQDRPLEIQLQIPALNRDEVHNGQSVRITFPNFEARDMPEVWSAVSTISADAFVDETTRVSYYRADLSLDAKVIEELGNRTLAPGMPVQAFVQTGDRSPIEYLVKPLTDYLKMAFKE